MKMIANKRKSMTEIVTLWVDGRCFECSNSFWIFWNTEYLYLKQQQQHALISFSEPGFHSKQFKEPKWPVCSLVSEGRLGSCVNRST